MDAAIGADGRGTEKAAQSAAPISRNSVRLIPDFSGIYKMGCLAYISLAIARRAYGAGSERWQKQFFEKEAAAFALENKNSKKAEELRIHQLEDTLRQKHEVLSELREAHVQFKKELGEL